MTQGSFNMKGIDSLAYFSRSAIISAKELSPQGEKLFKIKIEDFLKICPRVNSTGYLKEKKDNVEKLASKNTRFRTLPHLRMTGHTEVSENWDISVIADTAVVISHEGRHRSMFLKSIGKEYIPVVVKLHEYATLPKYVVNQVRKKKYRFDEVFLEID